MIVWEGITVNGYELTPNVNEMDQAVSLAKEYSFRLCLLQALPAAAGRLPERVALRHA
ncbi:MAG: hypothetical protein MZV70_42280 [Desulfobacterales bacterium]|nr:hypothetical protein [Desulfobacterales bacterium]